MHVNKFSKDPEEYNRLIIENILYVWMKYSPTNCKNFSLQKILFGQKWARWEKIIWYCYV